MLLIVCFIWSTGQVGATPFSFSLPGDTLKQDTTRLQKTDSLALTKAPGAVTTIVKYAAKDSIEIDAKTKRVNLYGEANVDYDDLNLKADFIYIDFNTNTVYAFGKRDTAGQYTGYAAFKQGDQEYKVRNLAYNFKTKRGQLSSLVTKEGDGIIYGDKVKKDEFNNTYVRGAKFTTCDAEHPHFYINAQKLKIIPEKQVIVGPANLVIEDVPTPAFIPFGFFPITKKQKSGVIIPQYGSSPDRGFFFRNGGYYFAINDKLNTTLTGDIYTLGSWGLYNSTVYRKRYQYNGSLGVRYNLNKITSTTDYRVATQKAFFINWDHTVDAKARPNTQFSAKVNAGTSNYLSFNSYNPVATVTNTLVSSISYAKVFGKNNQYSFSANLRHSQNTITRDIDLSLPELFFGVQRFFPLKQKIQVGAPKWFENIGIQYSGSFRNDIHTKDSLLFTRGTLDTMRYGFSHSIPVSTSFKVLKYFTLSPGVNYQEYWYFSSTEKFWNAANSTVVSVNKNGGFRRAYSYGTNVSLTTRIYGMLNFRKGNIKAIRHVFTPTISWVYQPDFSEAKYGFYKDVQYTPEGNTRKYSIYESGIYGGPGAGKQGRLDYSFINNLEMKVMRGKDTARHEDKVKLFETFNVAGSYNFFADSLKFSQVQMNTRTTLFKVVQVMVNGTYDPYVHDSLVVGSYRSVGRFNRFELNENGRLARLVAGNIAVSTSLNPDVFNKNRKSKSNAKKEKMRELNLNPNDFLDFEMPWNLTLNYTYNYSRPLNVTTHTQNLTFNGDVTVSQNWKVGFNSGYDIKGRQLSYTSFDIHRNLHCWEFSFNWIPFGYRTSYFFTIRVRSGMLQELKLSRRRDWFDQGALL